MFGLKVEVIIGATGCMYVVTTNSAPDGDPSNNYGSLGETNSYTSELDTGLSCTSATSSLKEADIRARRERSAKASSNRLRRRLAGLFGELTGRSWVMDELELKRSQTATPHHYALRIRYELL